MPPCIGLYCNILMTHVSNTQKSTYSSDSAVGQAPCCFHAKSMVDDIIAAGVHIYMHICRTCMYIVQIPDPVKQAHLAYLGGTVGPHPLNSAVTSWSERLRESVPLDQLLPATERSQRQLILRWNEVRLTTRQEIRVCEGDWSRVTFHAPVAWFKFVLSPSETNWLRFEMLVT